MSALKDNQPGISAIDEGGNPVDWWFAYKMPRMKKSAGGPAATGYEYFYFDPNQNKLSLSANVLTDGKSALDLTLYAVFKNASETTGWILYNDEMPGDANRKDDSCYGHTKGVIAFDTSTQTALWLVHSWPKYSDPAATGMPTPDYGQTYLCLSLDLATASAIASQMLNHQQPQVYAPQIPSSLDKTNALYLLSQNVQLDAPGDSGVVDCKTRGGIPFKVIAKNRKWGKDFWIDLVGPTLKCDLDVESWVRGAIPPVTDSDGVHQTTDVKFMDFRPLGFPYFWPETCDHAKWAHTKESDWVCVGDINRMISQEKRGGGTVAFQNSVLWDALQKTDLVVPPKGWDMASTQALIKASQ